MTLKRMIMKVKQRILSVSYGTHAIAIACVIILTCYCIILLLLLSFIFICTCMLLYYTCIAIALYLYCYCIIRTQLYVTPYGQVKRRKGTLAFPKTFSFELRFWHNFVPDMHDSSEK